MVDSKKKKGWKYKRRQIVFLKGTKSTGLGMRYVTVKGRDIPWGEVAGEITELLGTHGNPEYSVRIKPRWQHFFSYKGISLSEKDIYIEGEESSIQYLDEGLFEL